MLKTPRPNTGLSEPIIGLMPQLHMVSLDILGELGGDRVVLASNPAGDASAKSVYPTLPVSFTKKRHSLPIFGLSALSCLCKGKGIKDGLDFGTFFGNIYLSWPKLFHTSSHILTSFSLNKCIHSIITHQYM